LPGHPHVTARGSADASLCIRKVPGVVRLMPRRAAAPLGPPIFPGCPSQERPMISCRSASLRSCSQIPVAVIADWAAVQQGDAVLPSTGGRKQNR